MPVSKPLESEDERTILLRHALVASWKAAGLSSLRGLRGPRRSCSFFALIAAASILLGACGPAAPMPAVGSQTYEATGTPSPNLPASVLAIPTATPTLQVTATPATYGPDLLDFPPGINPLTGLPVADSALLKIPAVLISVSHFPATARPQAGLSFAPFVYEFSITGGETRFLATFYGQFPQPEVPVVGNCLVRQGAFIRSQSAALVAGRVWLDSNRNGRLDPEEEGIPGICVTLRSAQGTVLRDTSTDSNGYYGFNVDEGQDYSVHFDAPPHLEFSMPHVGAENADSDADPVAGDTRLYAAGVAMPRLDAGLYADSTYVAPTPDPKAGPLPAVGPVRSGRLLYAHIGAYYQNSCLIYAFASPEVLSLLPHCAFVAHETSGGGEMLPIARMRAVAEDNMRHTASHPFDYSSNLYSEAAPTGGSPASELKVFFGNLDQSAWQYDPLYQAYLRYVDTADPKARGVLHADLDRLTGRQLHFENVVAVMADTDVVSPTDLDIRLDEGNSGPAYAFRDGRVYQIQWSTRAGEYEKHTGLRRPIRFLDSTGSPFPLRPGHTWVIIVTPFSVLQPISPATFQITYEPPIGEAR